MEQMTTEKLRDLITDSEMKPITTLCDGQIFGCPKLGRNGCLFPRMPTTTINDMIKYVDKMRCPYCEIPIDHVMDNLKGY